MTDYFYGGTVKFHKKGKKTRLSHVCSAETILYFRFLSYIYIYTCNINYIILCIGHIELHSFVSVDNKQIGKT